MFSWKTREYAQEVFAVRLAIGTFLALGDPGVQAHVAGKTLKKVVVAKGRLVSVVVQ